MSTESETTKSRIFVEEVRGTTSDEIIARANVLYDAMRAAEVVADQLDHVVSDAIADFFGAAADLFDSAISDQDGGSGAPNLANIWLRSRAALARASEMRLHGQDAVVRNLK